MKSPRHGFSYQDKSMKWINASMSSAFCLSMWLGIFFLVGWFWFFFFKPVSTFKCISFGRKYIFKKKKKIIWLVLVKCNISSYKGVSMSGHQST